MSQIVVRDQKQISACAVDIIKKVRQRRGKPLQPRDRMALQLLTPKNSALIVKGSERTLGCHQVSFDIVTDDIGRGAHRLTPTGIHILKPEKTWWNEQYGQGQFLWNLRIKEDPREGIKRILEQLFKFKMSGLFGSKASLAVSNRQSTIAADIDRGLKLFILRDQGSIETTLRRMIKAEAIYQPKDIGLRINTNGHGKIVLLFGKNKRFGVSFTVERF